MTSLRVPMLLLLVLLLVLGATVLQAVVLVRVTVAQPDNLLRLLYRHGLFVEIQRLLDRLLINLAQDLDQDDLMAAQSALRAMMASDRVMTLAIPAIRTLLPSGAEIERAGAQGLDLSAVKIAAWEAFEAAGASPAALVLADSALQRAPDRLPLQVVPRRLTRVATQAPAASLMLTAAGLALIFLVAGARGGIRWSGAALLISGAAVTVAAILLRQGLYTGLVQPLSLQAVPLDHTSVSNLQAVLVSAAHELAGLARLTGSAVAAAGFLLITAAGLLRSPGD